MGTVISFLWRITAAIIAQPGVRDFASEVARRAIRQGLASTVRAINNRTSTRKTMETFQ